MILYNKSHSTLLSTYLLLLILLLLLLLFCCRLWTNSLIKGGKSSLGFLTGGLLIGKMGGLDVVPGLGVVVPMELVKGKLVLIGGDTCRLLESTMLLLVTFVLVVVVVVLESPKLK